MASNELRSRFREEGAEVMSMAPDEFTQFLRSETTAVTKLVNDLRLPKE